jgi:putative ABC transport system substrate-binding protein
VTREIPIVTVMGSDPVASGVAASLSHPGGSVTGVTTLVAGLKEKTIDLLRELVPGLSQLGYLLAVGAARYALNIRDVEAAAKEMKLRLHAIDLTSPDQIENAVASLAKARVGAVFVEGNTLLSANAARIVAAIDRHRLPAAYTVERYVGAGGLMVYGPSTRKAFVRAATYVERILKGAKPGDLPFEQMRDLELIVNLKTARAQGLKVPQPILLRAERVIE